MPWSKFGAPSAERQHLLHRTICFYVNKTAWSYSIPRCCLLQCPDPKVREGWVWCKEVEEGCVRVLEGKGRSWLGVTKLDPRPTLLPGVAEATLSPAWPAPPRTQNWLFLGLCCYMLLLGFCKISPISRISWSLVCVGLSNHRVVVGLCPGLVTGWALSGSTSARVHNISTFF